VGPSLAIVFAEPTIKFYVLVDVVTAVLGKVHFVLLNSWVDYNIANFLKFTG
jgi:hypothetical protein